MIDYGAQSKLEPLGGSGMGGGGYLLQPFYDPELYLRLAVILLLARIHESVCHKPISIAHSLTFQWTAAPPGFCFFSLWFVFVLISFLSFFLFETKA